MVKLCEYYYLPDEVTGPVGKRNYPKLPCGFWEGLQTNDPGTLRKTRSGSNCRRRLPVSCFTRTLQTYFTIYIAPLFFALAKFFIVCLALCRVWRFWGHVQFVAYINGLKNGVSNRCCIFAEDAWISWSMNAMSSTAIYARSTEWRWSGIFLWTHWNSTTFDVITFGLWAAWDLKMTRWRCSGLWLVELRAVIIVDVKPHSRCRIVDHIK